MQRSMAGPAFLLLLALMISACGGGGAASPGDGGTGDGGAAATDTPAATDAPAATDGAAATDAAAPSEPAGGGGSIGSVCDLATTDELKAAFGVESVTIEVFTGPPDTCAVMGPDTGSLVAWVLTDAGGEMIYEAVVLPGQSTDVAGLGDRAAFVDNTGLLILKGDRLVTIAVSAGLSPEEVEAVAKTIGGHIAGRM